MFPHWYEQLQQGWNNTDFLNVKLGLVKVMNETTINSARNPWTCSNDWVWSWCFDSDSIESYLSSWQRYCQKIWTTAAVLNKIYKTQNALKTFLKNVGKKNISTCKYSTFWNSSLNYCILTKFTKMYPLNSCSYIGHALLSKHCCKSSSMK